MADTQNQPKKELPNEESENTVQQQAEVARILEEARQKVKPIVKRESEGELVTADLLGVRLKK